MRETLIGSLRARRRMQSVARVAVPLLFIVLLGGCLIPPEPKTEGAEDVFNLYLVLSVMALIVFLGVEGMLVYSVIRYRRRDDRLPNQLHGNNLVEIIWTAIPTVIVLALFVAGMSALATVEARADDPVQIEVEGFQWQWTFRYPDEGVSVTGTGSEGPVMVVPVGEPVRVTLSSVDVIHAFFVPQFLIKRDVVPFAEGERPNEIGFTVTEAGTYTGQCAEFCGTFHADMNFTVQGMPREEYDAYLAAMAEGEEPPAPAESAPAGATVVDISANLLAFDTDEIRVPAGQPFVIRFENQESAPHNVAIYDGTETLFSGEIITGPSTIEYQVPALEAGEYDFICDVHPSMAGTVIAE